MSTSTRPPDCRREVSSASNRCEGEAKTHCFGDFVGKRFEILVKIRSALPLVLLRLQLVLVGEVSSSLLVSRLVEGRIRSFSEKLNVLCFLLADEDRILEMDVEDDDEFSVARLEEEMFDVAEK